MCNNGKIGGMEFDYIASIYLLSIINQYETKPK